MLIGCRVTNKDPGFTHKKLKESGSVGSLDGFLLCNSRLRDGGGLLGHGGYDPLSHFIMF